MKYWTEFSGTEFSVCNKKKKDRWVKDIITLDTESSSLFCDSQGMAYGWEEGLSKEWFENKSKCGIMYIWMVGINETVYYGRNNRELNEFLRKLSSMANGAKLIIWIQNMEWDFPWISNSIKIDSVFCRQRRVPMKATNDELMIEFRDAYCLNRMSLEKVGEQYNLFNRKKVGELDYRLVRTPNTKLTERELEYCEYDCKALYSYIKIKAEQYNGVNNIPMTQTSELRKRLKEKIKAGKGLMNWYAENRTKAPSWNVYKRLVECFYGGYCHASSLYRGEVINGADSWDMTSSYPYAMISEKYPIGKFEPCRPVDIWNMESDRYAYMAVIRIHNVESKVSNEFLSLSRCRDIHGAVVDSGRVVACDYAEVTMTDADIWILLRTYDIERIEVVECYRSIKGWLPKELVSLICELYESKKILKALKNQDYDRYASEYGYVKELINGLYGMCVTKYITDDVSYSNESGWQEREITEKEGAQKLKDTEKSILLPYQWGVWVSAYGRKNLFRGIIKNDSAVAYTDTDSLKTAYDISEWVKEYNSIVDEKVKACCKVHGIEYESVEGIGRFVAEKKADMMKTLGPKKYACVYNGEVEITVSGLSKKAAKAVNSDLSNFKDGLEISEELGERLLRYYNDDQGEMVVVDYLGDMDIINDQKHGISLQPTTYVIGRSKVNDEYSFGANFFSKSC